MTHRWCRSEMKKMGQGVEIEDVEGFADIAASYATMLELRPNLGNVESFVQQVIRQKAQGYRLTAAWSDGEIVGLVGYRSQESLFYGRYVFVDDLVVNASFRKSGIGALLLDAARKYARELGCKQLVLETGLQKVLAQRFYFREGLLPHALGFIESLGDRTH
ncbi:MULTISPECIES: GNAT family N-acetyltransferase [unclassified Mesorhizobium]|uniref:GNAT family N-acetyltransferase n=1 Tax=unclassified Mesorhizobium TaxID=325217 RepID=UPI001CCC6816|nr:MULTISPECIES: GNAT family N-acetyltransferase [unclassified Mesorhizobium]MBZ9810975.1 GNAT family N-acetyltransferase [Mesorhizobium sp. ESP-6-2]